MDKVDIRQPKETKANANLPKTAEERAVALTDLMERLASHLVQETRSIRSLDFAALPRLVKEKEPMALVIEEMGRLLRIDRAGFAALPPSLLSRLKEANAALNLASEDNAAALRRMAASQRLLVDTVVGVVNQGRRLDHPAYGPAAAGMRAPLGHRAAHQAPVAGPATSATLNQHV